MKDVSLCFQKKYCTSIIKTKAFHPGPVLPPSGEGSPLKAAAVCLSCSFSWITVLEISPVSKFRKCQDSNPGRLDICALPSSSSNKAQILPPVLFTGWITYSYYYYIIINLFYSLFEPRVSGPVINWFCTRPLSAKYLLNSRSAE